VTSLDVNDTLARLSRYVFTVIFAGKRLFHAELDLSLRVHPANSIHLIIGGKGRYTINRTSLEAKPGALFFFTPGMLFEWESTMKDPLEFYSVRFDYAEAYRKEGGWHFRSHPLDEFPFSGLYSVRDTLGIANSFEHLFRLSRKIDHRSTILRNMAFQELLLHIAQDILNGQMPSDSGAIIEASVEYMMQHYREKLNLDQLARQAGWSTGHYCKIFRNFTGYSPTEYLIRLRITRAKELLEFQHYKLKDIAASVGYEDEFYFSRLFKKTTGVSPKDFAKRRPLKH
jgi:AraC-like DNA-binding protein/mannose-6-phosphate isomerase-like protein (cupin superfamily)